MLIENNPSDRCIDQMVNQFPVDPVICLHFYKCMKVHLVFIVGDVHFLGGIEYQAFTSHLFAGCAPLSLCYIVKAQDHVL